MHSSSSPAAAFAAAAMAMGELGVAGCIGAACVQQEIITPDMVRALSKTIFYVLLPMFIGTAIMKTVVVTTTAAAAAGKGSSISSTTSLGAFLAVPILAALQAAIMFFLSSNIIIPLFLGMDSKGSDEAKSIMAVTCSFGNAGVLPFVFAEAMFRDSAPSLLEQAYSQVSLFSAGWSPFFWSFVPKVLGISPSTLAINKTGGNNTTLRAVLGRFLRDLQVLFPPPVVGVVTGLLIGLCPPLSSLLLSSGDKNNAPLAIIYNSFQNLGKAANPLAVLVLACSLAFGATTAANKKVQQPSCATTKSAAAGPGPVQKWACVSLARFIISPLVMFGLLCAMSSKNVNMISSPQAAPMTWFICLLEAIMPPAQNSVVLLQIAGRPHDAEELAKFLFSIYATSMLPIVVLIMISLQSLQILS